MKYRIKHETYLFLLVPIITLLLFVCFVILLNMPINSIIVKIDVVLFVLAIILFIIEQIVGTYIIVDDNLKIRRLLRWQNIPYGEIVGINIEPYERYLVQVFDGSCDSRISDFFTDSDLVNQESR